MARTKKPTWPICVWTDTGDFYESTCGRASFVFTDAGPVENGFTFCPFCGCRLKAKPVRAVQEST